MMNYVSIFTVALVAITAFSCEKKDPANPVDLSNRAGYFKSHPVEMGYGKLYSWVKCDINGKPESLGFTMTKGALENLSTDSIGHGQHMTHNVWEVQLPKQAQVTTPFKHIAINWNSKGHLPGPYALPHFDFHFYTITSAERAAIPTYSQAPNKFNKLPGYEYFPANYFCPGDTCKCQAVSYNIGPPRVLGETAEPEMGMHWIDLTAPELNPVTPAKFTETFVYGSYDGKVNYLEPMITLDFLKKTANFSRLIPQPASVQEDGYYPTKMCITRNNGDYSILFEGFQFRLKTP